MSYVISLSCITICCLWVWFLFLKPLERIQQMLGLQGWGREPAPWSTLRCLLLLAAPQLWFYTTKAHRLQIFSSSEVRSLQLKGLIARTRGHGASAGGGDLALPLQVPSWVALGVSLLSRAVFSCLYLSLKFCHYCWFYVPSFSVIIPFYFPDSCGKSAFGEVWVQKPSVRHCCSDAFAGEIPSRDEELGWQTVELPCVITAGAGGFFLQEIQWKRW